MYNNDLIQRYLDTIAGQESRQTAKSIITRFAEYADDLYGKELAEISREELIEAFGSANVVSISGATNAIRILRSYQKWYQHNVSDKIELWGEIKSSDIDKTNSMRLNLYPNIEALHEATKEIDLDSCEKTLPLIYLSWYGLEVLETIALKEKDVIFEDHTAIVRTERTGYIKITDYRSFLVLYRYAHTDSVEKMKRTRQVFYKEDSDKFLKKIYTINSTLERTPITPTYLNSDFYACCSRYCLDGNMPLSPEKVIRSGRLFRAREEEKRGELTDEYLIKEFNINLTKKPSVRYSLSKIRQSLEDYKKAFPEI